MGDSFDRFDWIVLGVLLTLGAATGLVLLRGDQVGVRVQDLVPAPDSVSVSTRTEIRLSFDEPMDKNSVERRFQIVPEVEGELTWRGEALIWRPHGSLAAETRYAVTLATGAQSTQGRQLKQTLTWVFHTGRPRVLYMSIDHVSQLSEVEPSSLKSRQLTRFEDGSSVWDYAVSPDGNQIVLGRVRSDSSAVDLWLMGANEGDARLLLACEKSQCSAAAWSPDGRRLAYERRELNVELGAVGMGPGPSRVWLLDLSSGQTRPLFQDSQMLGYAARWSPDGSRLGYFDPQGGVRVVNLDQDSSQLIPNQLGEMGVWSPDSQALVLVDLSFAGERHFSYLLRADLADGSIQNLSGAETEASDSSPAWSPSGEWIAFGRKALADGTPTPGQQLWLMRPDGSDARPLLTDPEAHLGSFAWSPDGRALAYLRFQLMQADARPEIWFLTLDDGAPVKLADNGTLPQWRP
jgi:Tol biopolymer transport system component